MARPRILRDIRAAFYTFIKIFGYVCLKDPCKKCIVQACCQEKCELKIVVINYIMPFNSLFQARMFSCIIITCWITILLCFIRLASEFIRVM
jgi:hypothetical protein